MTHQLIFTGRGGTHLTLYDNILLSSIYIWITKNWQRQLGTHITAVIKNTLIVIKVKFKFQVKLMQSIVLILSHHNYGDVLINREMSGACGWDVWIQCDVLFTALLAASEWNRITIHAVFTSLTVHKIKMLVYTLTLFCHSAYKTSMYRHCSHILVRVCWQP